MSKIIINGPYRLEAEAGVIHCDAGKVSDSYHTIDELYDHRCLLFLAFQEMNRSEPPSRSPGSPWKSRKHHDGSTYEGWFIAGIGTPGKDQISYHIPDKYWDLCKVPERETAPEWDGHTSQDVIDRLRAWLSE